MVRKEGDPIRITHLKKKKKNITQIEKEKTYQKKDH